MHGFEAKICWTEYFTGVSLMSSPLVVKIRSGVKMVEKLAITCKGSVYQESLIAKPCCTKIRHLIEELIIIHVRVWTSETSAFWQLLRGTIRRSICPRQASSGRWPNIKDACPTVVFFNPRLDDAFQVMPNSAGIQVYTLDRNTDSR